MSLPLSAHYIGIFVVLLFSLIPNHWFTGARFMQRVNLGSMLKSFKFWKLEEFLSRQNKLLKTFYFICSSLPRNNFPVIFFFVIWTNLTKLSAIFFYFLKNDKAGEYGGCGKVVHLNVVIVSHVLILVFSQSLSCKGKTLLFGKMVFTSDYRLFGSLERGFKKANILPVTRKWKLLWWSDSNNRQQNFKRQGYMLPFESGIFLLREIVTMLRSRDVIHSFILMDNTCSSVSNYSCTKEKGITFLLTLIYYIQYRLQRQILKYYNIIINNSIIKQD